MRVVIGLIWVIITGFAAQANAKFFDLSAERRVQVGKTYSVTPKTTFMPLAKRISIPSATPMKLAGAARMSSKNVHRLPDGQTDGTMLLASLPKSRDARARGIRKYWVPEGAIGDMVEENTSNDNTLLTHMWPVDKTAPQHLSSPFGYRKDPFTGKRKFHRGIDIAARTGTRVMASAKGMVEETGYAGGYGRFVRLRHTDGTSTTYGHLSRIQVQEGQMLAAGQPLGAIGSTGRSTGPHLDFSLRLADGTCVNPMPYLDAHHRYASAK